MAVFTEVARDVAFMRCGIVNIVALGNRSGWVLIDAALRGYAPVIRAAAVQRFGELAPSAIVLTHGHFDHIGALPSLLEDWHVPVYAHRMEMPYLTGRSAYPPPDPLVGRGAMAMFSRAYPRSPIDLGSSVREVPADGTVPAADGWRWIHTPGHTPGHIALYRYADRVLLSADAITTTKQESMSAVMTQRLELHGPPAYFTPDWDRARESVRALAALDPDVLISGHGQPWAGAAMRDRLATLAEDFDRLERPRYGRYAAQSAIADESGVVMLPPDPLPALLAGVGAIAATAAMAWAAARVRREPAVLARRR